MEVQVPSVESHDRTIECTETLVGLKEGGSHIDVFNGSINLCASVARINTNSMEWEATKERKGFIKIGGKCKVDHHRHFPRPCRATLNFTNHLDNLLFLFVATILALDQSIFFGDVPNYPTYASPGCC
jgi:hypothetical protein